MDKRELINYCLNFNDVYEDYPFDENWAVLRHRLNKKAFAFIYERNGRVYINLKLNPIEGSFYRGSFKEITEAYHMNKLHWNSVDLNSLIPDEILYEMIFKSYNLTKPKLLKKKGKN